MYKHDIISALTDYITNNPKLPFYNDCLRKIEEQVYGFKTDSLFYEVPFDPYIYESCKITLCTYNSKYFVYLDNEQRENCTNIKLSIDNEQLPSLLKQLVCITEYNDILSLAQNIDIPKIEFIPNGNETILYFVISDKKRDGYQLKNLYEISYYIFGIEENTLLKYQKMDRIIKFITDQGQSHKIISRFNDYLKVLQTYSWQERERMIIHSSAIYLAYGTTYTRDIDLLVLAETKSPQYAEKIVADLTSQKIDIDVSVLADDNDWHSPKNRIFKYKNIWLTYVLPNMAGAGDIFEVISNPKFYFGFMGVKFVSLEINLIKFLQRSNPNSLTDLIMFENINGYKLGDRLCIPNMTIRQGNLVVFDGKTIEWLRESVRSKLVSYYGVKMDAETISNLLQRCNQNSFDIYSGISIRDPDTDIIKYFHQEVKLQIYYKYCKDCPNLLDVGSGQMVDMKIWNKVNVKNVIGIEPSCSSIEKARNRINKFKPKSNIIIINGTGDTTWEHNMNYSQLNDMKFRVIVFNYTIHYMLKRINIVMQNIKLVSDINTKIIITCMDGEMIMKKINAHTRVEIRNRQEPIFCITPYDDDNILVYLKGSYGVANGSIESLVKIVDLINIFEKNGFRLIERKRFTDFNSKIKENMSYIQKAVSEFYIMLVFGV